MNDKKWPDLLFSTRETLRALFTSKGIANPDDLADAAVLELTETIGGLQVYFPRGQSIKRAIRNQAIYRQAGKVSATDLARKYGITSIQVYNIINQQTEAHRVKV